MGKIDLALWNNTEESGQSIKKITVGAHICRVIDFEDVEDKQYLKLKIDVIEGEFKGYFKKLSEIDQDKKWNHAGYLYRSYKPSAYPFLKNFVTSLEKSNEGYNFIKTGGDFDTFKNKIFVGVFGEEETPYADDNGNPQITIRMQSVRSLEALREGKIEIPPLKKLSDDQMDEFNDKLEKESHTNKVIAERKEATTTEDFYETSKKLAAEEDLPFD